MIYMIEGTDNQDETITIAKKSFSIKPIIALATLFMIAFLIQPSLNQWYSSIPNVEQDTLTISPVIRGDLIRDVAVSGKAVAAKAP